MARRGIDYDIIDETSRPGYIKIKMRKTGNEYWSRLVDPDPPGTEYGHLTFDQLRALGMVRGMTPNMSSNQQKKKRSYLQTMILRVKILIYKLNKRYYGKRRY